VTYLDRDAIYVANTGSSSVSAFQTVDFTPGHSEGGVCGSPFHMSAPPTALGTGDGDLIVASAPKKTISLFNVDILTSVLTGPITTISTRYTPMAVVWWGNIYVANAEGTVSVYQLSSGTTLTEIPGSPFPAGSGPVALAATDPGFLYVANSQSNNISGYSMGPGGVLTPLPGSPFPAGTNPSSIEIASAGPDLLSPTFVIVTNRGSNNVSFYSVSSNGVPGQVAGSPFPTGSAPASSSFSVANNALSFIYVANSKSNDIWGYSIDSSTDVLTPLAGSPVAVGPSPSAMISAGLIYVTCAGSNTLWVLNSDESSGALTPVSGSPFPVGQSPSAVVFVQVPT
jgi:6-phosphogluconolactonase (cycloisomerase 2 family)